MTEQAGVQERPPLFSRADLVRLIVPLILEQILAVAIGMADTIMVAGVGEAAVSGISIVDAINILLINIFAALASGGAIVSAQYLGREDKENSQLSGNQLMFSTTAMSLVMCAFCMVARGWMLTTIYGAVEPAVMRNAEIYFFWSSLSYPFLALYNGGAALFRVMGNSKISLFSSLLMNLINVGGNALLIYGFGMGVAGAGIASLCSRAVGALLVLWLLQRHNNPFRTKLSMLRPNRRMIGRIMSMGVPAGVESSMFQVGKILIQGMVATMGTAAMAANAVTNSICSVPNVAGNGIGLGLITVVGQCVGAGERKQAKSYLYRLTGMAYLLMGGLNLAMFLLRVPIVNLFALSAEASKLAIDIITVFCIASALIWPPSFTLPQGLRAAGDARYTMTVSAISMWAFRVGGCFFFCGVLGLGVNGTWYAMYIDWLARAICFTVRTMRGRWLRHEVI